MEEALPAAHVVTRHETQPGRTGRNKTLARVSHRSALQPYVHGMADEPGGVQPALPPP